LIFVRKPVKYYYHYPTVVAIVVTKFEDRVNLMSVAWHTQISFDPPLYGILISPKRFTHKLLKKSKEFTLNFLEYEDYEIAAFVGRSSGRDVDKVSAFDIELSEGRLVNVPIISRAYAAYECETVDIRDYGDHTLFVGRILGVHYREDAFENNLPDVNTLLYLGSDTYTTVDTQERVKYGKEEVERFLKEWFNEDEQHS